MDAYGNPAYGWGATPQAYDAYGHPLPPQQPHPGGLSPPPPADYGASPRQAYFASPPQ